MKTSAAEFSKHHRVARPTWKRAIKLAIRVRLPAVIFLWVTAMVGGYLMGSDVAGPRKAAPPPDRIICLRERLDGDILSVANGRIVFHGDALPVGTPSDVGPFPEVP